MMTSSQFIFGLLFISLTGAHELNHFPENFVVAKRNDPNPVTLTCGATTGEEVIWKFDGEEMEVTGPNLNVSEVDIPMLGDYSCWSKGVKLSSTYLLLEAEEGEELESLVRCRAKSYDCNFSCKWTHSEYTAVRLGLGRDCSEGEKSCQWVSHNSDGGFHFELSHSLSPYAEESTMLELTAEAISDLFILRKTKRFYLRDIIRPDSPKIVRCEKGEQGLNVTIDPPSSWSIPHSFFTLEHEIEYELKDNGKTGRSSSGLIPNGISKLRARSRDSLVLSDWSKWTPWKNVRTANKNLCKRKKTAKSCSPELPSGYLGHCRRRKKTKGNKDAKWTKTSKREDVL